MELHETYNIVLCNQLPVLLLYPSSLGWVSKSPFDLYFASLVRVKWFGFGSDFYYMYCMYCIYMYSVVVCNAHVLILMLIVLKDCIISCVGSVDASRCLLGDANGRLLMLFIETEQVYMYMHVHVHSMYNVHVGLSFTYACTCTCIYIIHVQCTCIYMNREHMYHKGAIAPLYIGMARVGQHRSHTFAKSAFPWQ